MKWFVVLVFSLVFSVGIVENIAGDYLEKNFLGNRTKDIRFKEFRHKECYRLSDHFGFEPKWGECGFYNLDADVRSNGNGDVLGITDQGIFRIVVLGDSITARSKYPALVEDLLNEEYLEENRRFEIISLAVESYNTAQEVRLLRDKAINLRPDFVILQFSLNDFEYSPVVVQTGEGITYFSAKGEKSHETNKFLFQYSALYRLKKLAELTRKIDDESAEEWEKKVEAMSKTLEKYKEVLRVNNLPQVIVVFPIFSEGQFERERRAILALLEERDIFYIDLLPHFQEIASLSSFAGSEGGQIDILHPNAVADGIVAGVVSNNIEDYLMK